MEPGTIYDIIRVNILPDIEVHPLLIKQKLCSIDHVSFSTKSTWVSHTCFPLNEIFPVHTLHNSSFTNLWPSLIHSPFYFKGLNLNENRILCMCLFKSTVHLWSRIKNASINWPTMKWGAWPNWAKVLSLYSNKGLTRYLTRGTTTFNVIQINADFDGVITTKLDAMHWLGCGLISIHTSIKEIIISGGGSKQFHNSF